MIKVNGQLFSPSVESLWLNKLRAKPLTPETALRGQPHWLLSDASFSLKLRVTVIEQEINERRFPAADINNDARILAYARRGDERQRQVRPALIPTDILRPLGLIHLIPLFLTIHLIISIPLRTRRLTSNQKFLEDFSALAVDLSIEHTDRSNQWFLEASSALKHFSAPMQTRAPFLSPLRAG
ncbi:MAG: hypothetical protein SGJ16_06275 [Nitrospirota bacterium]|nr:hypothetical protein [Nitrospirota bacterium]